MSSIEAMKTYERFKEQWDELDHATGSSAPVWRCKVCGYLCARPDPPLKCPICKADKDRFERFDL
jgi:rubrerythrin